MDNLDIFNTVGFSVAHDENIPIKIKNGNLITAHGSVKINEGEFLQIKFVKVSLLPYSLFFLSAVLILYFM